MAMNMRRAFNAKMLTRLTLLKNQGGYFDDDNTWVKGEQKKSIVFGRVIVGNKFSQFSEGLATVAEDGGERYTDYRSLYVRDIYDISIRDQIIFKGKVFNIIQQSDETVFGFNSFLIEAKEI
jgi:hypothetical protein